MKEFAFKIKKEFTKKEYECAKVQSNFINITQKKNIKEKDFEIFINQNLYKNYCFRLAYGDLCQLREQILFIYKKNLKEMKLIESSISNLLGIIVFKKIKENKEQNLNLNEIKLIKNLLHHILRCKYSLRSDYYEQIICLINLFEKALNEEKFISIGFYEFNF